MIKEDTQGILPFSSIKWPLSIQAIMRKRKKGREASPRADLSRVFQPCTRHSHGQDQEGFQKNKISGQNPNVAGGRSHNQGRERWLLTHHRCRYRAPPLRLCGDTRDDRLCASVSASEQRNSGRLILMLNQA